MLFRMPVGLEALLPHGDLYLISAWLVLAKKSVFLNARTLFVVRRVVQLNSANKECSKSFLHEPRPRARSLAHVAVRMTRIAYSRCRLGTAEHCKDYTHRLPL